jgi:large subunit ribosomal protein L3
MLGLIGKKIGMASVFNEIGHMIPVTVISAGPCRVIQVKTKDTDGYSALQLGFEPTNKMVSKPLLGHFARASVQPHREIQEFRISPSVASQYKPGDTITVGIFNNVQKVRLSGTSKGHGTQGPVKRYHFSGGPKTHGQKEKFRAPGSIGASSSPSKVLKGLRMAGRMGNEKVTVAGIKVVKTDEVNNLLLVRGAVPGPKGGYIRIVTEK